MKHVVRSGRQAQRGAYVRTELAESLLREPSCVEESVASYGGSERSGRQVAVGLQGFITHFIKRGNGVVPFQKRGRESGAFNGARVQFPYGINHGVIVSVQNVFPILRMFGDMNLRHALGGNTVHVGERIETMILR